MENLLNRIYLITFTGETNRSGWIARPTLLYIIKGGKPFIHHFCQQLSPHLLNKQKDYAELFSRCQPL